MRLRKAPVLFSLALLSAVVEVGAMGFGEAATTATLGQPLQMRLPVRLDGESLEPQCVSAEVLSGEQRLSPSQVRVQLDTPAGGNDVVLRVTTTVALEEPVVHVTVSLGCPVRLQRRLVALVDPPQLMAAPAAPVPTVVDAAGRPLAERAPLAEPRVAEAAPRDASPPSAPPRAPASPRRATPRSEARSPARAEAAAAVPARAASAAAPAATTARAPSAAARLQLELAEPASTLALAQAEERARVAEAAASAAQAAASAADARVRNLEQGLARLQAESAQQREAMAALQRERAATGWSWPWLLVALLALACALLAWQLRRSQRLARGRWWQEEDAAPARSAAAHTSGFDSLSMAEGPSAPPALAAGLPSTTAPMPATVAVVPRVLAPAPLPPATPVPLAVASPVAAETRRGLTIEEHIDLEQQADFFLVLGQDDAAVDLLLTQLRGTGGTSPMPYLKLMQIYRRLDDEVAYERTRERFEQRFNAHVPRWADADLPQRSLAQYPQALARVQQAWRRPLDAMAEVEALLFRRGQPDERFELAAYEELLFLYWLARELQQSEGREAAVDVLLPLNDGESSPPLAHPLAPSVAAAPVAAMGPRLDVDALDLVLDIEPPPAPGPAAGGAPEVPAGLAAPSFELVRDERDLPADGGTPPPPPAGR